jgi:hypothetical protein
MMKFILPLLFCLTAHGAVSEPDRALIETGRQILVNGGFEQGKASWVASGGTFATTQTLANVGVGLVAGSINFSSAAQTLTSSAAAIPAGLYGQNGYLSCRIQTPSGTATHKLQVYDGSNVVAEQAITSSTSYVPTSLNFIIPSSGNLSARLIAVAADEPLVNIDDCKLGIGLGSGSSSVAQSVLYGAITHPKATNCNWSTTSTTYTAFAADSDCTTPTGSNLYGRASAPATKIPGITFASLPPGDYYVVANGIFTKGNFDGTSFFRFSDGTNQADENPFSIQGAIFGTSPVITGRFSYTTAQSNVTIQVFAKSNTSSLTTYVEAVLADLNIQVYYFPSSSQQAINPSSNYLPVWGTFTDATGVNIQATGTDATFTNALFNSSNFTTNGNATVAGSNQAGITFTNVPPGRYMVVGQGGFGGDAGATCSFRFFDGTTSGGQSQVDNTNGAGIVNATLIGTFEWSSLANRTIVVQATKTSGGGGTFCNLAVSQENGNYSPLRISLIPLSYGIPVPLLVGSVTSNSAGLERIERATIAEAANCTSSPCTITRQSGSWLSSVTRAAAGQYTLNIASGIFSSPPTCTCISNQAGCAQPTTPTSTSFVFYTQDSAATPVDAQKINIICQGAR